MLKGTVNIFLTLYGLEEQSLFICFILCSFVETPPTPLSVSNSLPLSQTHTEAYNDELWQEITGQRLVYLLTEVAPDSSPLVSSASLKGFHQTPSLLLNSSRAFCQNGTLDKPFPYLMEFGQGGMKTMEGASRHRQRTEIAALILMGHSRGDGP